MRLLFLALLMLASGCQSTPKYAPSPAELEENLKGVAQLGFQKITCDLRVSDFDNAGTPTTQEIARQTFGRRFSEGEVKTIQNYKWKMEINEQSGSLIELVSPELASSEIVGRFVDFSKGEVRSVGKELARFYFDLLLDLNGKTPQLVPGGYLFQGHRTELVLVNPQFSEIKIKKQSGYDKAEEIVGQISSANGIHFPTEIRIQNGSYRRTLFFQFDETKNPPVPKEVMINFSRSADQRLTLNFERCELTK